MQLRRIFVIVILVLQVNRKKHGQKIRSVFKGIKFSTKHSQQNETKI